MLNKYGGHGISKIIVSDYPDKGILYKELIDKKQFLCEQAIIQSDEGKAFKEVHIAGVKEAFDMCKEAALKLPKVRYIGWDVAFSNNGPLIIEGNEYPGYGIIQHYKLNGKKTGHKGEIAAILGDEMNNI